MAYDGGAGALRWRGRASDATTAALPQHPFITITITTTTADTEDLFDDFV